MNARKSYKTEFPVEHGCSRRRSEIRRRVSRISKKNCRRAAKNELKGEYHV
jgi:hypothetical protein